MTKLGIWSATGAGIAAIGYGICQTLQLLGILPDPLDRILIFLPSLVLAPLIVLALAAAHGVAANAARPWRLAALALAILYATLASIVYSTQLGTVIPLELRGGGATAAQFACCAPQQPMTVLDIIGYVYLGCALMLLGVSYPPGRLRLVLLANGLLVPAILLQIYWPIFFWITSPWLLLVPAAMFLLARELAHPDGH